ncbi:MAG: antibiotic biosynthesis monooxygenase [Pseudomonadota bacterium]
MILITGTIMLESESELATVRDALVRRAERSRGDNGCIDYQFSVSLDNPKEIRLIERWESEALLEAHLAIPDPEFTETIGRGKIATAVVEAHEVSASREMMRRP